MPRIHVFLTLAQLQEIGQLQALAAYLWEKGPQYSLERRLGGPQSQSGHCGGDKIF
jgi:hypothetical protein